jgi:hypothetical protein
MADAFQPKFVDLVRNTTTTVGTADFTLGAAMTGFTSFTAACQPGDSFYYSAIGVDKPAEREVGRGTLLAGGIVSRDPIGGVKTNFSNGTKAVALITAAEWFSDIQSGAASGPPLAATRSGLAAATPQRVAVLSEGGREGMFLYRAGDLSALVAADPAQGIYIAPAGDPSGKSGAWVRKYDGSVNVKWFGATGDGSTDDSAAFTAALAYLKSIAGNLVIAEYKASPKLFIPAGHYYLGTTTIDVTHTLIIEGEGGQGFGSGGGAATMLRWDANATGIRIEAQNTSGAATVDSATHFSGAFTTLRQLYLYGGFKADGSTPEGEYHGIHVKAAVFLENVSADYFQGDGLHAHTTSMSGGADEGASNLSRAYNCKFSVCRNGISIAGGDANAWIFVGPSCLYNRACGIDDQSFLGNTYIHPHTSGNGVSGNNVGTSAWPAYVVSNAGYRYCPVQGEEAAASTTPPSGTADTSVWLYLGPGAPASGIPAWTSGMSLRCGAPYRTSNFNAPNRFYNPYEEGDQGFSQFVHPTMVDGGIHGQGRPKGTGLYSEVVAAGGSCPGVQWSGALRLTGENPGFNGPGGLELLMYGGSASIWGVDRDRGVRIPIVLDGSAISLEVNDVVIVSASSNSLDLGPGKVLTANGQQVIGARQTGTSADATDLATAITLVNDLKAKLTAHGLIA